MLRHLLVHVAISYNNALVILVVILTMQYDMRKYNFFCALTLLSSWMISPQVTTVGKVKQA